ncbi:MAG: hypothetical protein P0Y49_10870 [Candidatus Pedobacter colombiensis]|uniref:Uncharacterized protein n=1 Tax=Candidatus Pedobacter colombiensis TaxID=3121371 RepID=A0AAJ5WA44_9SPHI|nr:hypothetical protein [Pedobacter sp.]WEK21638.1 MAG: hypothetical protein P0Y49_10870 [Pedobacter sp.]
MKIHTKTTLHKLVLELMSPDRPIMEDEEIKNWMDRLPAIGKEVSGEMRSMLFANMGTGRVKRYLGQISKECTFLLDTLYQYPEFPERMRPLYQAVLNCLIAAIDVLHRSYAKYLDPLEKMPMLQYRMAADRIEEQVKPLVSAMSTYCIDKTLQALVVGKMTVLLKVGAGSWYQMGYLEKLQKWIFELCRGLPHSLNSQFRTLLLRANFNTTGFMSYCKAEIALDLAGQYDMAAKYDCLFSYKRELESLTYKHKTVKFDAGRPGVKDILLSYVDTELTCMDRKKNLSNPIAVVPAGEECARLPLAISADVLAYLFKLLVKVGVVVGGKRPMLAFIARSFQTVGIGNTSLSAASMDSKYRQVLKNTATTVKSILLKMLKQVDEEFG